MIAYRSSIEKRRDELSLHWWVSDGPRMLSATVVDDGGLCAFAGVFAHTPGLGCRIHARCTVNALPLDVARPLWDRVAAAGGADEAVWCELGQLHARTFAAVAR